MPKSIEEYVSDQPANRRQKLIDSVADLLDRNGVSPDDLGGVEKVKLYQGYYKDAEGVAHTVDMTGISLSPAWAEGPQWPVIQQGKPVNVKATKLRSTPDTPYKRAMTLPDIQVGYYFDVNGNLHPTHDEAALDVALQLVAYIRPDVIIMHGDNGDLPEMSKYRLTSAFAQTTQMTIDRLTLLMVQLRAVAGDECEIIWLEGNHEARLSHYVIDNAKAAFGLRVGGTTPDSWPVLSVPFLCRLDEQGVRYEAGYPANETWINDNLRVIHGNYVVSNGSTAHRYLANERVSVIYGHVHRREWAERTRATRDGPRTILAMSPGCLARTDGGVPSTKGGTDLFGVPVRVTEDWQSGLAVVRFEPGDGKFLPEMVSFIRETDAQYDGNGWTIYHGKEFRASVEDVDGR